MRKAMSKAINRPAIVEKVMEGEAIPSGQLVADFLFGATKNLKVEPYDPEGAKKLLAEAGYPDGFGLTIHAPNNRYVNDAKIAQAVAQMLARVGIDTKVVAMPSSTFFTQATDLKFSFMLLGWSTGTGEASSSLKALLMTYNRDKGYGTANRGRYSNAQGRRADRGRAADGRRRQARGATCSARPSSRSTTRASSRCTSRSTCGRRATASPTCRASTRTRWRGSSAACNGAVSAKCTSMNAPHPLPAVTHAAAALHRQSLGRAGDAARRCR